ncbi:MAG: histidine kinase dimerization/phospho-acceptor domain-containing protein, partial [Desulfoprunum sp.]|nr:histidine kinase dimerization/phospho-acceptor domain-containing protein [Desulfoprunum sp.]
MFQGTRLRTKLLMALLAMSSIPLLVIGTLSITTSNKALSELAFGQLESLRDVKRTHIQRFFEERLGDMEVLLQTVTVFEQTAFAKMRSVQEVKKAQVEEYFRKFRADITVLATNVNLFKMKDFELLLDGQGGVRLATLDMYETQYFGTSLRQLARDYGYDDLLLITDQGNVVYTVARGPDLGQNLLTGPLKQSSLAACFKKGLKEVTIEDFAPYPPLKNQPMAFIAAPVVNTQLNITIGVVVFRISHRAMNTIVHRREGMGVSGETFLAGRLHEINSLRSDQIVRDGRVGEDVADGKIDRMLSGVSGAVVGMGRTGTMEISHYDPLNIVGLNWGIITAMSLEEAITPTLAGGNGDYFSQFIHQYGYSDLLLIHPDGTVFYTVAYNTDYGTNLKDGPHVATGLGQVFRQVLKSKAFSFADFQPYAPFAGKPVAFMAQPVMKNDTVELIVAVQIPIDAINAVMQERSGMGLTGETYLVGPDQLMRSDSYADPERFAVAASFAHPETGRVDTQASREALAGKTGQGRITNYLGKPVLSAYAPLKIWDVNWALIAEMNTDEAFAAVQKLSALISGVGIIVLAGIVVFSLILTGYITKPIHQLVQLAQKVSAGDLSITLQDKRPGRDEIGILIQAFNAMIRQLRQSFETLEERVVVRTHELNDSNQQLQIAKDAAETANRAKSDFLSRMSHELRTPLNAILGYAQILKHHNNLFEAQRQQLDIMRSSGEHLLTLINDILDVGKIEASKMEVEDLAFDLPALMGQVFDLTKLQAEEKTLSFQYEADTPLPAYVRGDERKLRQILLNLLSNAVKYTSRGSVTMRVSYTAAGLFRCEVIDTGIGIPEDKLEAI